MQFINTARRNQLLGDIPNRIQGWCSDIYQQPAGWDQRRFFPWEPVRLLMVRIPARHSKGKLYSVVLMYKPGVMGPVAHNNMMFTDPEMDRLKGWICGPCKSSNYNIQLMFTIKRIRIDRRHH